jgi:hypothetical protein
MSSALVKPDLQGTACNLHVASFPSGPGGKLQE